MKIFEIIKKNNIIILFFLALSFMSVGFAVYNQQLNISGSISLVPNGKIEITNVERGTHTNAESDPQIVNNNTEIDFNLVFTTVSSTSATYTAEFDVTIVNNTFDDCVFNMPNYKPDVIVSSGSTSDDYSSNVGLKYVDSEGNSVIGKKIPTKTEMSFTIVITFINPSTSGGTDYEISGNFTTNIVTDEDATLMGSVDNSPVADLTGTNETATCTIEVINSYSTDQPFTIAVANTEKFAVQHLEDVNYTIAANSEDTFKFYLTKVEGAEYPYDSTYIDIVLENQGQTYNAGSLTVKVDQDIEVDDTTPPTIRNVTATIGDSSGTAQVSWEGEDDVSITSFTVYAYKEDTTTEGTFNKVEFSSGDITVSGGTKTVLVEGLEEGNYYFTVFGTDSSNNTPDETTIANATTSEGEASRSEEIALDWLYSVTVNVSNCTYTGAGENIIERNGTCEVTFTQSDTWWGIPSSMTSVTMGGVDCENYTYDSTTGVLTIPNVTGDIIISASPSFACLAEGTKVLLANGTYKNIEHIEYTDLLAVYDHLNGGITYVYPVWIEKGGVTSSYQKITFDDGTYIDVVMQHCLFDCEKNRYVNIADSEEFGIGSKVYKVENGELKVVTATKIEYINEEINYYDVLSTTHYNIIANNLITTDKITQCANILYGFKENAIFANWEKVIKSKQIEYEDVSFFSYDIFRGCNFNNTLFLVENNYLNLREIGDYLISQGKEKVTKNGDKYFMITTSVDELNSSNPNRYLYKEGSVYIFPKIGVKYFIDTATNKKYKEGEQFTVYNSTHFQVVY